MAVSKKKIMEIKKYEYTKKCKEVTGLSRDQENACRKMVVAGVKWFDDNPKASPKFKEYLSPSVVVGDNSDTKSIEDAMLEVVDDNYSELLMTAFSHCLFASKNGWDKYIEVMESKMESMEGNVVKDKVLKEYLKGNIVVAGIEGLQGMKLSEFVKQPVDGMLYDLNRNEATILTFIDDPKWVNDYAVAKVIRALKKRIDELEGN